MHGATNQMRIVHLKLSNCLGCWRDAVAAAVAEKVDAAHLVALDELRKTFDAEKDVRVG